MIRTDTRSLTDCKNECYNDPDCKGLQYWPEGVSDATLRGTCRQLTFSGNPNWRHTTSGSTTYLKPGNNMTLVAPTKASNSGSTTKMSISPANDLKWSLGTNGHYTVTAIQILDGITKAKIANFTDVNRKEYTHTGLQYGRIYRYIIRKVFTTGDNIDSDTFIVRTLEAPHKASNKTSGPSQSKTVESIPPANELNWALNDDGGYTVREIQILNGTTKAKIKTKGASETSHKHTGLQSGKIYRYIIRKVLTTGDNIDSDTFSVKTLKAPHKASNKTSGPSPTKTVESNPPANELNWALNDDGGYTVREIQILDGTTKAKIAYFTDDRTKYTHTGLHYGRTYTYIIRKVLTTGDNIDSDTFSVETLKAPRKASNKTSGPSPTKTVESIPPANELNWAPNDDGGYTVAEILILDGTTEYIIANLTDVTRTTYTHIELQYGRTYRYIIRKVFTTKHHVDSVAFNVTTLDAPHKASNKAGSSRSKTIESIPPANELNWALNDDGGYTVREIQIRQINGTTNALIETKGASETKYTHSDLEQGRTYTYIIRKLFEIGHLDSEPIILTTFVAPRAPSGFYASNSNWYPSNREEIRMGTQSLTDCKNECFRDSNCKGLQHWPEHTSVATLRGKCRQITFSGNPNWRYTTSGGTTYLKPENDMTILAPTQASNSGSETKMSIPQENDLKWSLGTNGHHTVTAIQIFDVDTNAEIANFTDVNRTTYTHGPLVSDTIYRYKIRKRFTSGTYVDSATFNVKTLVAPRKASDAGSTTMKSISPANELYWVPNTNGAYILLEYQIINENTNVVIATKGASETSYTHSGLSYGRTYTYIIRKRFATGHLDSDPIIIPTFDSPYDTGYETLCGQPHNRYQKNDSICSDCTWSNWGNMEGLAEKSSNKGGFVCKASNPNPLALTKTICYENNDCRHLGLYSRVCERFELNAYGFCGPY